MRMYALRINQVGVCRPFYILTLGLLLMVTCWTSKTLTDDHSSKDATDLKTTIEEANEKFSPTQKEFKTEDLSRPCQPSEAPSTTTKEQIKTTKEEINGGKQSPDGTHTARSERRILSDSERESSSLTSYDSHSKSESNTQTNMKELEPSSVAKPSVVTSSGELKVTAPSSDEHESTQSTDDKSQLTAPPGDTTTPTLQPPPTDKPFITQAPPGDSLGSPGGIDLPSFDEWSQKMLAEQAKTTLDKITNNDQQTAPTIKGNGHSKTKYKNYASAECGAKVLSHNSEASNPSHVLSENRDLYMNSPCKGKKWFVIELCESLQHIKAIEIANFELFSSTPETFRVHYADRYPTKDWKHLGKFRAKDERVVQSFSLEGVTEQIFSQFVKVEMLSHYGTEHYCPLSILRVYGIGVHDINDDTSDEEVDVSGIEKEDNSLFITAKDTILNVVKTVTGLSNGADSKADKTSNATLDGSNAENRSQDGVLLPCTTELPQMLDKNLEAIDTRCLRGPNSAWRFAMADCLTWNESRPNVSRNDQNLCGYAKTMYKGIDLTLDSYCPVNVREVISNQTGSVTGSESHSESVTKIPETKSSSDEVNMATVVDSSSVIISASVKQPDGKEIMEPIAEKTDLEKSSSSDTIMDSSKEEQPVIVGTSTPSFTDSVNEMSHVTQTETQDSSQIRVKVTKITLSQSESRTDSVEISPSQLTDQFQIRPSINTKDTGGGSETERMATFETLIEPKPIPAPPLETSTVTSQDIKPLRSSESHSMEVKNALSESSTLAKQSETFSSIKSASIESQTDNDIVLNMTTVSKDSETSDVLPSSKVQTQTEKMVDQDTTNTENDSIVTKSVEGDFLQPSTSETLEKSCEVVYNESRSEHTDDVGTSLNQGDTETLSSQTDTQTAPSVDESSLSQSTDNTIGVPSIENTETDLSSATKLEPSEQEFTPDNEPTKAQSENKEMSIQIPSIPRKDTAVMRLNNRVKLLETNISLSSRYLEQLSLRYRKQMEEMQKAFNLTISQLTQAAQRESQRDNKQQEDIAFLEDKISNMSHTVSNLTTEIKHMYIQVIETHVFLILVEICVMCLIVAFCMNRGRRQEIAAILNSQNATVHLPLSRSRSLNSFIPNKNLPVENHSHISGTEKGCNIAVIEPRQLQFNTTEDGKGTHRKKKKKKKFKRDLTWGGHSERSFSPSTLDSNAGVLFQGAGISWNDQTTETSSGSSIFSHSVTSVEAGSHASSTSSSQVGLDITTREELMSTWKNVTKKSKKKHKKQILLLQNEN